MADKPNDFVGIAVAPPPPPVMTSAKAKNLMKSPASLMGEPKEDLLKESVVEQCKNFLRSRCNKVASLTQLSWFYYNNDIDASIQDGPTCGLIALKIASDVLKMSGNITGGVVKSTETEISELLCLSQDSGFTHLGEMFSARDMAALAQKYYHINYKVTSFDDYVGLVNHVIQGYPVIVPYDSDKNNEPCLKKGHTAHWAVITGFLLGLKDTEKQHNKDIPVRKADRSILPMDFESSNLFVIARHGKSRHYGLWQWNDLCKSNNNLIEFDPGRCAKSNNTDDGTRNCLLTEGMQGGLCSKALFFNP